MRDDEGVRSDGGIRMKPPQLEPHARSYVLRLIEDGGEPLPQLSLEAARQVMRSTQTTPLEHSTIEVETLRHEGLEVTIVRPANSRDTLPAVLYLHGGGWVLGGVETHARIVRELALRVQAAIVVPEYALSPEARFPVALDQCYKAAQWLEAEGGAHNIDGTRLAVAGDSAGGNLAAALCLRSACCGGPKFRLQALLCPALQASSATDSYREFAEGLNLTLETMAWFWDQYVPDTEQRLNPEVSPILSDSANLIRVAPALIITAECDVLRDEGERYAQLLMGAGVEVTALRFLGTLHNFLVIDALRESGPSVAALGVTADRLRRSLHEKDVDERLG
jgi:acetyl esterase